MILIFDKSHKDSYDLVSLSILEGIFDIFIGSGTLWWYIWKLYMKRFIQSSCTWKKRKHSTSYTFSKKYPLLLQYRRITWKFKKTFIIYYTFDYLNQLLLIDFYLFSVIWFVNRSLRHGNVILHITVWKLLINIDLITLYDNFLHI